MRAVRVSISPDNTASWALASQYGFTRVGEQWDEEDGLETVYEVPAGLDDAAGPCGRQGAWTRTTTPSGGAPSP